MKNVTIALDDDTHRKARIRAAELGTSLSALVRDYLNQLTSGADPQEVRDMPMPYSAPPPDQKPDGPPWLIDGKWVYTRDGNPRQPGALRDMWIADDFNTWPDDILESFDRWDHDDPKPE